MKIAQVAPLYESVPPKFYGGTERVVSYLTEALVEEGHEVTLFAAGDSVTKARLISHVDRALRLSPNVVDPLAHHFVQLQEVIERAHEFDIIHFHTDYLHFPSSRFIKTPCITTLHGRLDIPELRHIFHKFTTQPVISISNSQRLPLPEANWLATVYHGLPEDLYEKQINKDDYLAFIGRISQEKRPDRAIEIAKRAGLKIKLAAKVDKADEHYFNSHIKHLMDQPHVEYLGEIGEAEKRAFLGNARALLFPIDWPEPFGMVMIEAMACGTPVIAYPHGSVPEIIEQGKTGFIVSSIEEAVNALDGVDLLDRNVIRETFEKRFSAKIMASNYVKSYELLTKPPVSYYFNEQNFTTKNTKLIA